MNKEEHLKLYKNEILAVKSLGEQIGYGNLMDIASVLWAETLRQNDLPDDAAFYPTIINAMKEGELKKDAIVQRLRKTALFVELGIWSDKHINEND